MSKSITKKSPLKIAHRMEIKGAEFYLDLAVKSVNALAKNLFYSLATREIEHARRIDDIYESINDNKSLKALSSAGTTSLEVEIKSFFKLMDKSKLRKQGQLAGYKFAVEMEKESIKLYTGLYEKAQNKTQKEFYGMLVNEEREHYDALFNVYRYLTETGDWFQEEESRTWNWMNLG
jgi:rubrerythrin